MKIILKLLKKFNNSEHPNFWHKRSRNLRSKSTLKIFLLSFTMIFVVSGVIYMTYVPLQISCKVPLRKFEPYLLYHPPSLLLCNCHLKLKLIVASVVSFFFDFMVNGWQNLEVCRSKIPKNFSSLWSAVSEKLTNEQTNKHID